MSTAGPLLALALAAAAGSGSGARVDALHVHGSLSDDSWRTERPIEDFLQREPTDGGEPSDRTDFRVAYNETTLFVKVRAYERHPDGTRTYLTRRDQDSPSDWIRVFIDSYHDRRTAYEFAVNPSGVKMDRYWYNDNNNDDSWDAVWDVVVSSEADGWSAEFRIPFSQLRFSPSDSVTFGFAVARQVGHLNETSTWPLLSRNASGFVSSFGELGGLAMSAPVRRLEVVPYTVASVTMQPSEGNPLVKTTAPDAAVGLDLKYALTPGLTVTTTVNPDFGQVEADPAVVNLSAFETFFDERRPFFVEGSGNFKFDMGCEFGGCSSLFYPRRVGRAPQGTDSLPDGDDVFTSAPTQTTILGASKLTGRVGRFSLGLMEAVTSQADARIRRGFVLSSMPVEPLTSYSVARVRREFANQSSIGMILTATRRQARGNLVDVLPERATVGGADWDLRVGSRYSLTGYWIGSTIGGTPAAITLTQKDSRHYFQRPDLGSNAVDDLRTSLSGDAAQISIGKIAGAYIRFNSRVSFKSPGFEPNDLGFLRRADTRSESNWIQFRSDRPNRWFRSRNINFNQYATWNFDGDRLNSGGNVNAHAMLTNNWSFGGGYNLNAIGLDDRATRGGPVVAMQGPTEFWHYLNTDNRRLFSLSYDGGVGSDGHGTSWRNISPSITYRPLPSLMIKSGVSINQSVADSQWVKNVTDLSTHYVFAHLAQTTVSLTERINYTMSPNLSLQLYAQPFVSGGSYDAFKELVDGRNKTYAARYMPYAYDIGANENPDFNVKSFRTTNVLRWEYRPGAALFIVWQQARENDTIRGRFDFGRDLGDVFAVPSSNVFLVKLAYWLNR
jgi:Domain of unknown function (DUF5916)